MHCTLHCTMQFWTTCWLLSGAYDHYYHVHKKERYLFHEYFLVFGWEITDSWHRDGVRGCVTLTTFKNSLWQRFIPAWWYHQNPIVIWHVSCNISNEWFNWKFSFFPSFWGCITLIDMVTWWHQKLNNDIDIYFFIFGGMVIAYALTNRCPAPPIYYVPMAYCPPPQRDWIDLEIFMTTTKTSWTRCYNVWAGVDCNSIDDPAIGLHSRSKDGNEGSCTVKQI